MKSLICSLSLLAALAAQTPDVVIYGGTAAAVAAAVELSRSGRTVAIVAPETHIGGITVDGLGSADINNHWFRNDYAVGGLAAEFYRRIGAKYGQPGPVYKYESHVAEAVFADWLREHNVAVHRDERLNSAVEWHPGTKRLRAIRTESGRRFEAKVFLDATLEGDLLAAAGVETTWGREANAQYNETKNGIRAETTHAQFAVKVDPYRIPGDPRSGLIATIQDEPLGTPGAGDRNIQAFCFRLCLTKNPANRVPFPKPANFRRENYEIYFRYAKAGGKLWTPAANLPNGKTDLGSWHDLSANLYGENRDWPTGSHLTRRKIYNHHRDFTQGLLWVLANDPAIPAETRNVWREWGLAADEFIDNGNWPRQLYVRDGRRMVSDFVMTEHHTRRVDPTPVPDPVAVAFWPTDTHSVRRIVRDGAAYNEGFVFDDNNWGPFGVSYRALTPRRREAENLLTPTCPSSTHVAYGAIRLEQTFLSLGQAAGAAAALAVEGNKAVQDVDYRALRQRLTAAGQVVEVTMDLTPPAEWPALFAKEVTRRVDPPAALLALYQQKLAATAGLETNQFVAVVDRAPKVQLFALFLRARNGTFQFIGASPVSTGLPGRFDYFETPLGLFAHTIDNGDFRALGTPNENGILGYGRKGMRVFDLGWVTAPKGWGDKRPIQMRLQMHATDPRHLEPRLGRRASKGCIRIHSTLNEFLDRHGILDAEYAQAPARHFSLRPDWRPSTNAGRALLIVDSSL